MSTRILILKDGVIKPGTSSDISLVDLTSNQTIGGNKTFTGTISGITPLMVGLGNVNNTSDINKPVSTATQSALNLKANLSSPNFTDIPTVPTASIGNNSLQAANTAFVSTAIANLVSSSPSTLDTLNELATALGNDPNFATTISTSLGLKANIASPTFTGNVGFSGTLSLPTTTGTTVGTIWRNGSNLEFKDTSNVTQVILNSAGNLSNLSNKQIALNNLVGTLTNNRVLRSNGTNVVLAQVDLTTDVIGVLPPANGGSGNSASYVDLTTAQTIGGIKTFNGGLILPTTEHTSVGAIWRNGANLEFRNNSNTTQILLNSAGNLSNLGDKQISLNNLVGAVTSGNYLRGNGTNIVLSAIQASDVPVLNQNTTGTATNVTGIVNIANGGTGSNVQNFVDLTTNQNINGSKYFNKLLAVGINSSLAMSSYSNADIQIFNGAGTLNIFTGSLLPTANITATLPIYLTDVEVNSANTSSLGLTIGHQYRIRNFGSGAVNTLQGGRFTALHSSSGTTTNLDGGYFLGRNEGTGTVTTITGGQFLAQITSGTAGSINGAYITVSANAATTLTTARGLYITASTSNTTPATECIGIDIASITGTATNKIALRTGTGRVIIGDTTATTSTTTGSFVTGGGGAFGGTIAANLPTSPTGLSAGTFWRNGNVVNVV
jgi:hypothetical protein